MYFAFRIKYIYYENALYFLIFIFVRTNILKILYFFCQRLLIF